MPSPGIQLLDQFGKPITGQRNGFALPPVLTTSGLYYGSYKTFLDEKYDEALKHNRDDGLAMKRDCWLMSLLNERIDAVLGLKWSIEVDNPKDPRQKQVADGVTKAIQRTPRLRGFFRQQLQAVWYGRYANQVKWKWQAADVDGKPNRVLTVAKHTPVNGDKIGYQWYDEKAKEYIDTPYVRISSGYGDDALGKADYLYSSYGKAVSLKGSWRDRFLIHTFNPVDADFLEGDMQGGIHGQGIRSVIYWNWWMRDEGWAIIWEQLERIGLGLVIIYYDESSDASLQAADELASNYSRRAVIKIPRPAGTLQSRIASGPNGIEVVEAPTGGIEVVQALRKDLEDKIERFIVGQSMSGGKDQDNGEGLGGKGQSDFAADTKRNITLGDANDLEETQTGSDEEPGLASVITKWSYPWADFPVRFKFHVDEKDPEKVLDAIGKASSMGVTFKEESVRGLIPGQEAPGPDDKVVGGQQQQPGGQPGMPGQPAPAQQPGEQKSIGIGPDEKDIDKPPVGYARQEPPAPAQTAPAQQPPQQQEQPSPPLRPHQNDPMRKSASQGWLPAWDDEDECWVVGDDIDLDDDQPQEQVSYAAEGEQQGGGDVWVGFTTKSNTQGWRNTVTGERRYQPNKPEDKGKGHYEQAHQQRQQRAEESLNAPAQVSHADTKTLAALQGIFGHDFRAEDLPTLVGALPGSKIDTLTSMSYDGSGNKVTIWVNGPRYMSGKGCQRTLKVEADGSLTVSNDLFFLKKKFRGGAGLKQFSDQVRECVRRGADRIKTCAGKGGGMNGYYTWPRLGYDAPLDSDFVGRISRNAQRLFKKQGADPEDAAWRAYVLAKAKTVQDLMQSQDGRDYWKKYGEQTAMTFDLSPGSKSIAALNAYLATKGLEPIPEPQAGDRSAVRKQRLDTAEKDKAAAKESDRLIAEWRQTQTHYDGVARQLGINPIDLERLANEHVQRAMQATGGPNSGLPGEERYNEGMSRAVAAQHPAYQQAVEQLGGAQTMRLQQEKYVQHAEADRRAAETGIPHEQLAAAYREQAQARGVTGLTPLRDYVPQMRQIYYDAINSILDARHRQRMDDPASEPIHQEAAEAAVKWGLLPEDLRAACLGRPSGLPDAQEGLRSSYSRAMTSLLMHVNAVHETYAARAQKVGADPAQARAAAEEFLEQNTEERRANPHMQYGTSSTADILEHGYSVFLASAMAGRQQQTQPQAQQQPAASYVTEDEPLAYESHHAPKGGVNINGRQYVGGEFIPADQVEKASPEEKKQLEVKRSLPEKIKHAPAAIKAALSPEAIDKAAAAILDGAKHPVATAGKAKDIAKAKLKSIYEKYGPVGVAAIATAYVSYYAAALAINPAILAVPVPLTPTLLTCAEIIRRTGKKVREKIGYERDEEPDTFARIQETLAALKAKQAEEARKAEEAQLYAKQQREAEQAALLEAIRADDAERQLYQKSLDDRESLIKAIREGLKESVAEEVAKAVSPVVKRKVERDRQGRIARVVRTHADGTESVQKIKRDAEGQVLEVAEG